MYWQYTPLILSLVIVAVASVALAFFAWRQRHAPAAMPFAILTLAGGGWTLGYALELSSPDLPTKIFWVKVYYIGIVVLPITWLALALQYTGQGRWLTRRNLILLATVPAITLLLIWTNEAHGLFWSDVELDTSGAFPMLNWIPGAWFWVYAAYSNLVLLLGTALFVQALVRSPRPYRSQIVALLISVLTPWAANAIFMFGLSPLHRLDLTPFAFIVSGLVAAWGLFRFQLFDIVPVARDAVIESLRDGVIVLDAQNRIVDLNPAAEHIVGCTASTAIGQLATQAFSDQRDLAKHCRDMTEVHTEAVLDRDGAQSTFDLRITRLRDRHGRIAGRLVVLHDISQRKQVEEKLRYLSTHDALTGLYNRAYFEDELERLKQKGPFPVSIIVADVNELKAINDTLGHAAGDELLRRAAVVLTTAFRAEDVIARIGGDEFAVLIPGADAATAAQALARVRHSLLAHNAAHSGLPLTISLGTATAETSALLTEALRQADTHMYRDKFTRAI